MKRFTLLLILGLILLVAGCTENGTVDEDGTGNGEVVESAEPQVEWHSNIFTAVGDDFHYEGTIHNGGRGTAKNVEVVFLFPEDLVQRKRSEVNPIPVGDIGAEEIGVFDGKIEFDFTGLTKPGILEQLEKLEIKIRWTEDGVRNEDYLRQLDDIQQKQAS